MADQRDESGFCNELLNGKIFYWLHSAQILIEYWRCHYNTVWPRSPPGLSSTRTRKHCPNGPEVCHSLTFNLDHSMGQSIPSCHLPLLKPVTLLAANTIGNLPLAVLFIKLRPDLGSGPLFGLAMLSTSGGNLFLAGSISNIIVAERAACKEQTSALRISQGPAFRSPFPGWRQP
jgi:hypothetical protein